MKKKISKDKLKERISFKLQCLSDWIYNNKESIVVIGPLVVGGVTGIVKFATRHATLHKQEALHDLYCYDRSLGHYWKLKRKLSNKEWLEIDKRKNNGERLSDILSEMKILK